MADEFYAPERVLVVAAHADDIEFGCSGTVARWTDAGTTVTYCIVTDNSSGSNDPATDLEQLIATRRAEQIASAKVVGVEDVRFLNYPDGVLQPTLELRRDLTRVIRQVRPQIVVAQDPTMVFTPGNDYINHPDHRAAAEAAIYATFPSSETRPIFRELLDEGLEPHRVKKLYLQFVVQPTLYVDITSTFQRKADALLCHKSQVGEDVVKPIREWAAESGKAGGFDLAESFRVITINGDDHETSEQN